MRVTIILRQHWVPLWHPFFERLVARHGVTLTVICPAGHARDGVTRRTEAVGESGLGYELVSVPCRWRIYDHEAPMMYARPFGDILAASRPDVIYVIGEAGYLCTYQALRVAERLSPRPKFCLYAAQNIYQNWPPPFAQTERYCLRRTDMLFPIGEEHEAVARRKGYTGPAVRMPLGVDQDLFRPVPPMALDFPPTMDGPVVGYIGKLTTVKAVDLLLEAAAACRPRPSPRLLIIGRGPEEARLRALAEDLGLAERVLWVPEVRHQDMPAWIAAMDVLVLPSRQKGHSALHWWYRVASKEQFGRVLVEAMACERPVIGSSSGEIPHVIGEVGFVFTENSVEDLARQLSKLLADPTLRQDLGQRGRQRVLERYTWDLIAQRYYDTWCQLGAASPSSQSAP